MTMIFFPSPIFASEISNQFTVSLWVNPTSSVTSKALVGKAEEIRLFTDSSGYPGCQLKTTTWQTASTATTALALNTWSHVSCTYNKVNLTLYVNGVQAAQTSLTSVVDDTANTFLIGEDDSASTTYTNFIGTVDQFQVYNYVRTQKQIVQDMLGGGSVIASAAGGGARQSAIGYWDFDEGIGTTANNLGNGGSTLNGALTTYSASWSNAGKFGKALYFNESPNTTLSVANPISTQTVSLWTNPTTLSKSPSSIDFDASSYALNCSAQSLTWSHTIGSGSNRALIVQAMSYTAASTISNVTYNGVALTKLGSIAYSSWTVELWRMTEATLPAAGAHNIVVTTSGATCIYSGATSWTGINQSTPTGTFTSNTGIGTAPTIDVSSATGEIVIDAVGNLNGGLTANSAQMDRWNQSFTASSSKPGASTTTMNWTGSVSNGWTIAAVPLKPASSSPALQPLFNLASGVNASINTDGTIATTGFTSPITYVNGKVGGTATAGAWNHIVVTDTVATNANAITIGQISSSHFYGLMDEIKMYNYALTASEILTDYNHGSSLIMGALGNNSTYQANASNQIYCVPGDTASCNKPAGEWHFDEKSGGTAYDSSGNSSNFSLGGGTASKMPTWITGKVGGALDFDGVNDYATATRTGAYYVYYYFTIQAWIKKSSQTGTAYILTIRHPCHHEALAISLTDFGVWVNNPGSNYVWRTHTLPQNTWAHLTATFDTATGLKLYLNGVLITTNTLGTPGGYATMDGYDPLRLGILEVAGECGVTEYNGKFSIDELKIYDYARSPAQIAWDYNKGKPVASYDFDECSGSSVNDLSGNSRTGTITIGGSGTQSAVGTCTTASTAWGNGATGKRNSSLKLDGNDDFLTTSAFSPLATAAQTTKALSWGGWFYPTTAVASRYLMEKATNSTTAGEFHLYADANSMPICGIFYSSAFHDSAAPTQALTLSAWNHVICTYDGTNINTYLNGKLIKQSAETNNVTAISSILYLGEPSTSPTSSNRFEGQLDDLQIYNYALTSTQVKNLMNNGAVNYAPATGSP